MATYDGLLKDHPYGKGEGRLPGFQPITLTDRTGPDHSYCCIKTPKRDKRKRVVSTPTGLTPQQPNKILDETVKRAAWTEEEKLALFGISKESRNPEESESTFWARCADAMNQKYPGKKRTGNSCKSASRRLRLFETPVVSDMASSSAELIKDVSTQTDLSIPVTLSESEPKEGEWVFMEPKRILKSTVDGIDMLHGTALKRLRRYSNLKGEDRLQLIQALLCCSSKEIVNKIMTSPLRGEILLDILYDIEYQSSECCNKGNVLCQKDFSSLADFKWCDVLESLLVEQPILAEILLAVALPTGKIGNKAATESVLPVLCSVYGMLMKQRYHELSLIQKVVAITLADEQTNQKVNIWNACSS